VTQMGSILGGRELKAIRYDYRGSAAEAAAVTKKLVYEDKVSAVVQGLMT